MLGSLLSAVLLMHSAVKVEAGKFIDDLGREYNFKGSDKFGSRAATGALSLYRMGLRDEISSIWGLWSIRGSDLDIDNPEAGSRYPDADPSVDEVNWLHTKNNLSPGCHTNPRGCFRWDNTSMVEKYADDIDYILFIDNGNDSSMRTITNLTGIPVVFIDTFYEYTPECRHVNNDTVADYVNKDKTQCFGRSMIDIANRIEELAIAIDGTLDTELIQADKALACAAAQKFTLTMKQKQKEGLRVMTTINKVGTDDDNGKNYFEIRTLDPIDLWVPRTLEELGMPILHHDDGSQIIEEISTRVTGNEFFPDCEAWKLTEDCNGTPLYPVDFWLFDSRSYLNVIDNEAVLKELFPDKAILAGQHWHYARNDGPLSYHAIFRMLDEMTRRVSEAQRMHAKTDCTPIDPRTAVTAQIGGGLDRNEYICYNEDLIQSKYLQNCAASEESADVEDPADVENLADVEDPVDVKDEVLVGTASSVGRSIPSITSAVLGAISLLVY